MSTTRRAGALVVATALLALAPTWAFAKTTTTRAELVMDDAHVLDVSQVVREVNALHDRSGNRVAVLTTNDPEVGKETYDDDVMTWLEEHAPESSQQESLRALGDEEIARLVERYAEAWERGDVDAIVGMLSDDVLDAISDVLAKGGNVNFTGFGKFAVAERGPRQGVNPRTGERIHIPGGKVPRFSAGSGLKKKVKGGG